MENGARDSTQEWLLPDRAVPATVAELETRIDEAIAIARASEAAAMTVGAAAIESAEQARRAADLAVKASEVASRAGGFGGGAPAPAPAPGPPQPTPAPRPRVAHHDDRLVLFTRRADRVGARFAQLQRR